jgi:hypothetical protein
MELFTNPDDSHVPCSSATYHSGGQARKMVSRSGKQCMLVRLLQGVVMVLFVN